MKAAVPFPSVFPQLLWCGKQHDVPRGFVLSACFVGSIFLICKNVLPNFIFSLSGMFKSDQRLGHKLHRLVDLRTSHAVADFCKTIARCLCAFSRGRILLWKNCSGDEICLSIKQNILLAHSFLIKQVVRPASPSHSLEVCLSGGYLHVETMLWWAPVTTQIRFLLRFFFFFEVELVKHPGSVTVVGLSWNRTEVALNYLFWHDQRLRAKVYSPDTSIWAYPPPFCSSVIASGNLMPCHR